MNFAKKQEICRAIPLDLLVKKSSQGFLVQVPMRVQKFLEGQGSIQRPLLLGYSGGPDSHALLLSLLEYRQRKDFDLHLAHVDHGWREESRRQAEEITVSMHRLGLPLHQKRLGGSLPKANPEGRARDARLAFFKDIYSQIGAQALLLGHQADDQAETVLKRVLEGAHFSRWAGIHGISHIENMVVWRPLLSASKQEILAWLQKKQSPYLEDSTNLDPQFLRGRMRKEIIPYLSQAFGKRVEGNLRELALVAEQWDRYLHQKTAYCWQGVQESVSGISWDISPYLPMDLLEVQYLLKELAQAYQLMLSRPVLVQIAKSLLEKSGPKSFFGAHKQITVKGGCLFIEKHIK